MPFWKGPFCRSQAKRSCRSVGSSSVTGPLTGPMRSFGTTPPATPGSDTSDALSTPTGSSRPRRWPSRPAMPPSEMSRMTSSGISTPICPSDLTYLSFSWPASPRTRASASPESLSSSRRAGRTTIDSRTSSMFRAPARSSVASVLRPSGDTGLSKAVGSIGWPSRRRGCWAGRHGRSRSIVSFTIARSVPGGAAKLAALYRQGVKEYYLGNHPLWQIVRALYQMRYRPYGIGGLAILTGFVGSFLQGVPRAVPPEVVRFCRREQMMRLGAVITLRKPGGTDRSAG